MTFVGANPVLNPVLKIAGPPAMSDLKATLNDKMIGRLALADKGQYVVRDADLRGFFLTIGTRRKTFTVQGECWKDGKRHTKKVALGSTDDLTTREARVMAKDILARIAKGEFVQEAAPPPLPEVTLRSAWARYRTAHMERKERSPATIAGYADHVERVMKDWLDLPLKTLGENPRMVAERHDAITKNSGPAAANGCMRTLRAYTTTPAAAPASCRPTTPPSPSTGTRRSAATRRWASSTCQRGWSRPAACATPSAANSISSHCCRAAGQAPCSAPKSATSTLAAASCTSRGRRAAPNAPSISPCRAR